MNIAFNFLPYSPSVHGGAEVYLTNVLIAMSNLEIGHRLFLIAERTALRAYLTEKVSAEAIALTLPFSHMRAVRVLAEQFIIPLLCIKNKIDCIISNYVSPLMSPCSKIVIVHDMIYRRHPETFEPMKLHYWKKTLPTSIRRSTAVVTVSKFSAHEIETFFPATKNRLFVTVEGIRPSLADSLLEYCSTGSPSRPYLLCVATFGKHKNLDMLVKALAELPATFHGTKLVFVGAARTPDAKEYRISLESLIHQLALDSRVVFMDHVPDAQLAALYRGALALVLPSLYEGFGLPIIEAQHLGCPVLCSNVASIPEIAGEAAVMFDPRSVDSIRDAIALLLGNAELAERLRVLGYQNVKRFSWEKAAEQLLAAIQFAVASST